MKQKRIMMPTSDPTLLPQPSSNKTRLTKMMALNKKDEDRETLACLHSLVAGVRVATTIEESGRPPQV